MFKKIFSLVLLSFLAVSCGKKAQAQELIYAPSNLQDSQCGDPTKGQYTCDADSIRYTYDIYSLPNNSWYNNSAINSETPAVFGPYLNLPGAFSTANVSATVNVPQSLNVAASSPNACSDYGNTHEHLFDIVLAGSCGGSADQVLQRVSVNIARANWSPVIGGCVAATNFYPQTSVGVAYNSAFNSCSSFQLEARQVNPKMIQIPKPGYYPVGFHGFSPTNIIIIGK